MKNKIQAVTAKDLIDFCKSLDDQDLGQLQDACMDEILNRAMASSPSIDEMLKELDNGVNPFCSCPKVL